jgi:hypothetical protein
MEPFLAEGVSFDLLIERFLLVGPLPRLGSSE